MKHYLNVCDINGAEIEPVDLITFGSPCQDLSVAGKRKGLKHEENGDEETTRSGLFMEAIRIIKEMRESERLRYSGADEFIRPRFAIWENVCGAFSSNKGEDFRVVLEELAHIKDSEVSIPMPEWGGWRSAGAIIGNGFSIAWRVFDAQYWGTPQRRRRIYLVADFGGQCAPEILFKPGSLQWNFAQSSEKREEITRNIADSTRKSDEDITAGFNGYKSANAEISYINNGCPTIEANMPSNVLCMLNDEGGNRMSAEEEEEAEMHGHAPIVMATQQGGAEIAEDLCPTITAAAGMSGNNQPCVCMEKAYSINHQGGKEEQIIKDISGTMTAAMNSSGNNKLSVCYGICAQSSNSMKSSNPDSGIYKADTSRTLDCSGSNPTCNQGGIAVCEPKAYGVVSKGNGDAFLTEEKHMSISCGGGQAGQGTPTVCEPIIADMTHANDVLRVSGGGSSHITT